MARFDFGGTLADFVVTSRRLGGLDVLGLSAATLTFWDSQSGGTKYTDLQLNGSPASSITVGADGQVPKFQGPDGVTELWVDGGSPRIRIVTLQGAQGPQGLPGVNAVANDTATAGYINGPSSTRTALDAVYPTKATQPVNVKDPAYGAVGNGVADDTTAIRNAITAGAGKVVTFPPGTYKITSAINITTSETMLNLGDAKVTVPAAVIPFNFTGVSGTPLTRVGVRGGYIDLTSTATSGIILKFCDDAVIDSVAVSNGATSSGSGIGFQNCNRARVTQATGSNLGLGVSFTDSPGGSVVGGTFTGMKRDGVLLYHASHDSSVVGVTVNGFGLGGESGRGGVHSYGSSRVAVTGCSIKGDPTLGSDDSQKIRMRDSSDFAVTGNTVSGARGGGIGVVTLSDVTNPTGKGVIAGNTIRDVSGQGIQVALGVSGVDADLNPVNIVGNTIIGVRGVASANGDGIIVVAAGDLSSVSSNYVEDLDGTAINLSASGVVSGNLIRNVGKGTTGPRCGIAIVAGKATVVGNNVIDDQATPTTVNALRVFAGATARTAANLFTNAGVVRNDGTVEAQMGEISSAKVGFFGGTPAAKPASPGTATGTDAAVINAITAALRTLGLVT